MMAFAIVADVVDAAIVGIVSAAAVELFACFLDSLNRATKRGTPAGALTGTEF